MLVGPQAGQGEGADKTDQVENAPRVEPGDQGNAQIENGEVSEQSHHLVAAGGDQQGGSKTFERGDDRQNRSLLQNGQNGTEQRDGKEEGESRFIGNQLVEFHCGQGGQVEHADTHALQDQGVIPALVAQEPAES